MPSFSFQALDPSGKAVSGELICDTESAALDILDERGCVPISVVEGAAKAPWWARDISFGPPKPISNNVLEPFFDSLSTMLSANLPLAQALRSCADMTEDKAFRYAITNTARDVENGDPLHTAFAKHATNLPARLISLVELGERSNTLPNVTERIATSLRAEIRTSRQLQQALIYPAILLAMSILVIGLLVFYLAPTLAPVFRSSNSEPPFVIALMLSLRDGVTTHIATTMGVSTFGLIGLVVLGPRIIRMFHTLLEYLPVTGRYIQQKETLNFCSTLDMLLSSGSQLQHAMKIAADTAQSPKWKRALADAVDAIEDGATLRTTILSQELVDPLTTAVLSTGEQTDSLHKVLPPAIAKLEDQTAATLAQAVKLLTPILTLLIGFTVGAIILSTISAIMDLNDAVL